MGLGRNLALLGGIMTILGTYVFAVYGTLGWVGSGIGFILNISDLFGNADIYALGLSTPVLLYYIYLVLFIIFLASGVLQMLSTRNRAVGFIFSLFPLGVGLMFIFLAYTDFLGIKSYFFTTFFGGEHYGNIFPFLVDLGDLALGSYLLIAGGALGVISVFSDRD